MISNVKRFSEVFADEKIREKNALVYRKEKYTYGDMQAAVELCASDLIKMGVKSGDHVGIWAYNGIGWMISMMAIVRLGAVAVLANYSMPVEYAAPLLDYTDVDFLVYGHNRDTHYDKRAGEKLAARIGLTPDKIYNLMDMDFKGRLGDGELPENVPEDTTDPEKTAVVIFTTGTTAMPKAVMLSQRAVLNNGAGCGAHIEPALDHAGVCIALPLFHSYGLTVTFGFLLKKKTVYLVSRLKPDEVIDMISQYHIGMVGSVGIVYLGMLSSPRFKDEVAPYVRLCIVGGEFTDPQQVLRVHKAYPDVAFAVGYGQTEAGPVISLNQPWDDVQNRAFTVGKPLPDTKIRIVNNKGEVMEQGGIGEVQLISDSMMNGYYKVVPEKQAIGPDGWLRTGDLGFVDENGYLRLTGRIKDIIIKNGENISPSEIENELRKIDGIKDVRVMGAPHPVFGEEIEACLTMMEGFRFDENAVRTQLMKYLIRFKMPEHFFVYDAFPMNANGKLNVQELKKSMMDRLLESQKDTKKFGR